MQSYKSALALLNKVDADVITFESCSAGGMDLEAFGKEITDKKIAIGVIDHHTLQVERPEEIADHIRRALKHIPVERLVLSSDCGMGREGMSRRHAFYKMVALVRGTNIVRRELGLPEAEVPRRRPALFAGAAGKVARLTAEPRSHYASGRLLAEAKDALLRREPSPGAPDQREACITSSATGKPLASVLSDRANSSNRSALQAPTVIAARHPFLSSSCTATAISRESPAHL